MLHTGKDITPILLILFKNFNIHNINTDTNTFTTSCAKNNISSTSLRVTLQLETKFSSDVKPILNMLTPKIKTKLQDKSVYKYIKTNMQLHKRR